MSTHSDHGHPPSPRTSRALNRLDAAEKRLTHIEDTVHKAWADLSEVKHILVPTNPSPVLAAPIGAAQAHAAAPVPTAPPSLPKTSVQSAQGATSSQPGQATAPVDLQLAQPLDAENLRGQGESVDRLVKREHIEVEAQSKFQASATAWGANLANL